jgi:tetratricopeptide (TPR) repeat protein
MSAMKARLASRIRFFAPCFAQCFARCFARSLALWAGLGAAAAGSAAHAECRLEDFAVVAVTMMGMRPLAHMTLDGQDAVFLVDTGAFASALSPAAAARHHIRVFSRGGVGVEGIGGGAYAQIAQVAHVQFGGAGFFDQSFLVLSGLGRDVDGVVGRDILGQADAEYDFANGVMRLVRPKGCGASDVLSYWTDRPSILSALPNLPDAGAIGALGEINGQKVRVGLDSGSAYSDMTLKAAARAGVTPASPDVAPARATTGVAGRPAPTWSAPFETFALGAEAVLHTRLRISQTSLGGSDMLLGADFFLAHRIYVSRLQRRIYFTYNGGPVFRLHETQPPMWMRDSPEGDPNAPTDAAGFSRRGAASMARNDLDGAVEDFGRAIALEPQVATFYFNRGAAQAADHKPDLALADFDAGLKLQPENLAARLARASVNIEAGRVDAARNDLDAAVGARSPDPLIGLEGAGLYERAGLYAQALAAYDQWIAANPRDELAADALAGRCRARLLAHLPADRTDLDQAARDCEAAVKARRDGAQALASRGLLHFTRGEFDLAIADSEASLLTGERLFWALESRGLAELNKGLEADGRADLAEAAKVDSKQAEHARALGLEPKLDPATASAR